MPYTTSSTFPGPCNGRPHTHTHTHTHTHKHTHTYTHTLALTHTHSHSHTHSHTHSRLGLPTSMPCTTSSTSPGPCKGRPMLLSPSSKATAAEGSVRPGRRSVIIARSWLRKRGWGWWPCEVLVCGRACVWERVWLRVIGWIWVWVWVCAGVCVWVSVSVCVCTCACCDCVCERAS